MRFFNQLNILVNRRKHSFAYKSIWDKLHLDAPLLFAIFLLLICGMILLYSAANGNYTKLLKQLIHIILGITCMLVIAQIHPNQFKKWTSVLFWSGISLLIMVKLVGYVGKGAQRWIDFGIMRFQPSELMKYAVPMMVALQLSKRSLPASIPTFAYVSLFILLPTFLIIKQPDLGTALLVLFSGYFTFLLIGLPFKYVFYSAFGSACFAPIAWTYLHTYQKNRILTFLNPESDPLGTGYHIIQSKIAIGSGGMFGKGWINGTQSHLDFLPERSTDFIFALCGEEFGLLGCLILLVLYAFISCRALYLSQFAEDSYSKILCGALSITFFLYFMVNIGMVSGILPIVGIPLPLVSYGGASMLTIMICFGIIMSVNSQSKLSNATF